MAQMNPSAALAAASATIPKSKFTTFAPNFTSFPVIILEKLKGSVNGMSWATSVELLFMGKGMETHLTTEIDDIILVKQSGRWILSCVTCYGNL